MTGKHVTQGRTSSTLLSFFILEHCFGFDGVQRLSISISVQLVQKVPVDTSICDTASQGKQGQLSLQLTGKGAITRWL